MRFPTPSIRATANGVCIDGPQGTVLLREEANVIQAEYTGHQLTNGSAAAYAETLKALALQQALDFPLAWSVDAKGRQHITDTSLFYQQTFSTALSGIERLKHWAHKSGVR